MSSKDVELNAQFTAVLEEKKIPFLKKPETVASGKAYFADLTAGSEKPCLFKEVHVLNILASVCSEVVKTPVPVPVSATEQRLYWWFFGSLVQGLQGDEAVTLRRITLSTIIHMHYSIIHPPTLDIFSHLSATEMFFIDGDSLLMESLSRPMVDWDLVQPIQVHFLVQRLLEELVQRRAKFHVLFFDSTAWVWNAAPQKRFLRETLKSSLINLYEKQRVPFFVGSFASWHCDEYLEHFKQYDPEFVLMADGEQLTEPSTSLSKAFATDAFRSVAEDPILGRDAALYYRSFMIHTIAHHTLVAFASRLVSKDNCMIAFVVQASSERFPQYLSLKNDVIELAKHLERPAIAPTALTADQAGKLDASEAFLFFREKVVGGALLAYFDAADRTPKEEALAKVLMITAIAATALPAEARSQPATYSEELGSFLTTMAPFLQAAYAHVNVANGRGQEFDVYDGHLVFAFTKLLATGAPKDFFTAEYLDAMNDAWAFIGFTGESITDTPIADLPELDEVDTANVAALPQIKHGLVAELGKLFQVAGAEGNVAFPTRRGAAANLVGWDVVESFEEFNDVLNVGAEKDLEEQRKTDHKARERYLRVTTQFVTAAQETAETLDAKLFLGRNEQLTLVADSTNKDGKDRARKKQNHAGQKKKYVRSKGDQIREENNMISVRRLAEKSFTHLGQLTQKANSVKLETRTEDREDAMRVIERSIGSFKLEDRVYNDDELIVPAEFSSLNTWRQIVLFSKRDHEKAFATEVIPVAGGAKKTGLDIVESYVDAELDKAKRGKSDPSTSLEFILFENKKEREGARDTAIRFVMQLMIPFFEAHYKSALEIELVRMQLQEWQNERERARLASRAPDPKPKAVQLFIRTHAAITRLERTNIRLPMDERNIHLLRSAIRYLEFSEKYITKIDAVLAQTQGVVTLPPFPEKLRPQHKKLLEMTAERFQLCEMGDLLQRPIAATNDPRVQFKPDTWQTDLLDIVDHRGSAVVCAPTSAGKTFISYYCMKHTLMNSNDRVVVYVAPSRALINQAVADVCARYSSKQYSTPGKQVYGVLGGDGYYTDPNLCQVLITLPAVLETILLSPKYAAWAKRIDYVIFDEIHSMESSGNGPVWERILALTSAPFIALSATLGETEELCAWLNRCQAVLERQQANSDDDRKYLVEMIPKTGRINRWNDIEKYVYQPLPGECAPLDRIDTPLKKESLAIKQLHPLSSVTMTMLRDKFPQDLSLVPKECIVLYDTMTKELEQLKGAYEDVDAFASILRTMEELSPEVYFAADRHIVQNRAREYEGRIKAELLKWAQLGVSNFGFTLSPLTPEEIVDFRKDMTDLVDHVLKAFTQDLQSGEQALEQYSLQNQGADSPFPHSFAFVLKHIVNTLREIRQSGRGPTIVFSFETEQCTLLVEHVVQLLEEAEGIFRQSNDFKVYQQSLAARQLQADRMKASQTSTNKKKKGEDEEGGRGKDEERLGGNVAVQDEEDFEVPDVLPEFAFFGNGEFNPTRFAAMIEDCEERGEDLAARAMKRGICIHHAGVPGKLRGHAEKLFRSLYCSVIFATETLALGIHSPCRTVVIAGDHILLNTTQFRQMMGRAGRRGLDTLGHLVFLAVPFKKINRLLTSDLMVIKGHVQVDPVTQLRLLQLHDADAHAEEQGGKRPSTGAEKNALERAERLFVNPLFFLARSRVEGGNLESFQVRLLQTLLTHFNDEGLHFAEQTSALGSLATNILHVFRDVQSGVNSLEFVSLLTSGIFDKASFSSMLDLGSSQEVVAEAVGELLGRAFSVNGTFRTSLETHRSILSDPYAMAGWAAVTSETKLVRDHRVVAAPSRFITGLSELQAQRRLKFLSLISSFYHAEAQYLKVPHDARLPFMTLGAVSGEAPKKFAIFADPSTEAPEPIVEALKAIATPFAARHPLAAVSGCGDAFRNLEELSLTLRDGLFADIGMFPLYETADNSRHDGSELVINAAIADFIRMGAQMENREYRHTLLEDKNGLTQSASYALLNIAEKCLNNLSVKKKEEKSHVKETLLAIQPQDPQAALGATNVINVCERMTSLRRQIDKQAALDRRDAAYYAKKKEAEAVRANAKRGQ